MLFFNVLVLEHLTGIAQDLNTSHVNLQLHRASDIKNSFFYLNTSHVNLQQERRNLAGPPIINLNTSHVNLQPSTFAACLFFPSPYLNTSHVNLQLPRCWYGLGKERFKYISC